MRKVADKTLSELKQLKLKDSEGNVTEHRIPTLDGVLQWARGKTVLVIDQKDVPLSTRIGKIRQHRAEAYAILIVSNLKDVQTCHAISGDIMMEVIPQSKQRFLIVD